MPERPPAAAVRAPWGTDAGLAEAVRALRAGGEIVVQVLPGHEHEQQEFECDRELAKQGVAWTVRSLRGDRNHG
jgi:ATP phosphoribosyltransferase regulatory subunit